jgi:hypothetical protein
MEPIAKDSYEKITGNKVHSVGLVVNPNKPFLGATPDGLIKTSSGELISLEIKCPISCEDKDAIEVNYLSNNLLKTSHEYYSQIQLHLFCLDLKKCHFFVFSKKSCVLLEICRDDKFI